MTYRAEPAGPDEPLRWLNAKLCEGALERGEVVAHHLPVVLVLEGPPGEERLAQVISELRPTCQLLELWPGTTNSWSERMISDCVEEALFHGLGLFIVSSLLPLVPSGLRERLPDALERGRGWADASPPGRPGAHCQAPLRELRLRDDGAVLPCRSRWASGLSSLGEFDVGTIEGLWNSRAVRNLRAGLDRGDHPAACVACGGQRPGVASEDPRPVEASSPDDLVSHFEERDLAPMRQAPEIRSFLELARHKGVAVGYRSTERELREIRLRLEDMEQHAANLQRRLGGILGSLPYRLLSPVIRRIWPRGPRARRDG
ncbi:MAG: SPASM domain-containing protein [Planctomycetota bacterium]